MSSSESLRAAVLVGAISVEPLPIDSFDLRVPARRRVIHHDGAPLDLDGPYFRYRIERNGSVHALPAIEGARVCRGQAKSHHARARSAPRS